MKLLSLLLLFELHRINELRFIAHTDPVVCFLLNSGFDFVFVIMLCACKAIRMMRCHICSNIIWLNSASVR